MRIQHNIAALNSHRQLGGNNNMVSKNLEKLSSGFRINRAGDDAAGLAISEKMRAQIKGLETAQKNAQDGISLVQTAEGNLTEVHSMLNRMVELATQSANGTYQDTNRNELQKEIKSLTGEIDRIAQSANFNGIKLLDGSLSGGGSAGSALTGSKIATYKAATVDGTASTASANLGTEKLVIDGTEISIDWNKLSTEKQAALRKDWTATTGVTEKDAKTAAQIIQDTINEALRAAGGKADIKVAASGADNAAKTLKITSGLEGTGKSSIESRTSGGLIQTLTGVAADTATKAKATFSGNGDMSGDFVMNINGTDLKITTSGIGSTTTAGGIASAVNTAINTAIGNYNAAAPADKQLKTTDFSVSMTDDGRLKVNNGSDASISFKDIEGGIVAKSLGITGSASSSGGGLTLQVGETSEDFQKVNVSVGNMNATSLGLASIDIGNQVGAASAMDAINSAIDQVSATRGDLGALQNRLDHTINNLGVTTENMTAAESRVRDVDMAKEMMDFTKNNILTQAAQAMLAQANQLPQGVLQLLQ